MVAGAPRSAIWRRLIEALDKAFLFDHCCGKPLLPRNDGDVRCVRCGWYPAMHDLALAREALRACAEAPQRKLVDYVEHRGGCKVDGNGDPPHPCTCGLDTLLAACAEAPATEYRFTETTMTPLERARFAIKAGAANAGLLTALVGEIDRLVALLERRADAPATDKGHEDVDRWRTLYRALAWMVNDYIGVTDYGDYKQVDKRLGYAHEGYHNANRVMREHKPPMPERLQRFNDGTGCLYGGNQHPDRCVCQEKETGQFAGTPHKHYDEPPYNCARCHCEAYEPATPLRAEALAPSPDTGQD